MNKLEVCTNTYWWVSLELRNRLDTKVSITVGQAIKAVSQILDTVYHKRPIFIRALELEVALIHGEPKCKTYPKKSVISTLHIKR